MFNLIDAENKIQKEEFIDLSGCNDIILRFTSENIVISLTKENKLKVVETSNVDLKEEETFICKKVGNKLEITQGERNSIVHIFKIGSFNRKIELFIPESYKENLEVNSSSGNIKINDNLNLNSVKCTQNSGNFKCEGALEVKDIDLKVSSGNINAKEILSRTYKINASSGNIHVGAILGSGDVAASSGNIELEYKDIEDYSTVKANSGNVKLSVPKGLNFEFWGECGSGDIRSSFDINYKNRHGSKATVTVGNEPHKKITVNTGSGNINLREK